MEPMGILSRLRPPADRHARRSPRGGAEKAADRPVLTGDDLWLPFTVWGLGCGAQGIEV